MSKQRTALYELITNSKLEQTEESFWVKFMKGITLSTKYYYLGPGTNLKKYLSKGQKPVNKLDRLALIHDLQYQSIGALPEDQQEEAEIKADKQFIKKLQALKKSEKDIKIRSDINHALAAMNSKQSSYITQTTQLTESEREQLRSELGGILSKKNNERLFPYISEEFKIDEDKISRLYDSLAKGKYNIIDKTLSSGRKSENIGEAESEAENILDVGSEGDIEEGETKSESDIENIPTPKPEEKGAEYDKRIRDEQLNLQKIVDEEALQSLQNATNPANYKKPESDDLSKITTGEFPGRPITGERNYNNIQQKAGDHEVDFTKHEVDQKEQFYKFFNLVVPGYGEGNQELIGVPNSSNIPKHTLKPQNCLLRAQNENTDIRFCGKLRVPAEKPFEYKLTKKAIESHRTSMYCDVGQTAVSWIRDSQKEFMGPKMNMYRESYEPTQSRERNSIYTRLAHPNIVQMQNGRITRL